MSKLRDRLRSDFHQLFLFCNLFFEHVDLLINRVHAAVAGSQTLLDRLALKVIRSGQGRTLQLPDAGLFARKFLAESGECPRARLLSLVNSPACR